MIFTKLFINVLKLEGPLELPSSPYVVNLLCDPIYARLGNPHALQVTNRSVCYSTYRVWPFTFIFKLDVIGLDFQLRHALKINQLKVHWLSPLCTPEWEGLLPCMFFPCLFYFTFCICRRENHALTPFYQIV